MNDSTTAADRQYRVAGIAGSLRKGSFNRALLKAAIELAPSRLIIGAHEIDEIPLYDADVDAAGAPPAVEVLRQAVRSADALLFSTPEYNHGVPGVLKNTVDWLSRPPQDSALRGKPAAIVGASTGMTGTARAQSQLRQAFVFTNTYAMLAPEVLVAKASEKFDASGRLTDEATRKFLGTFLESFVAWIARFAEPPR